MYNGRRVCDDACGFRGSGSNLAAGTHKYLHFLFIHCTLYMYDYCIIAEHPKSVVNLLLEEIKAGVMYCL